MDVNIHKWHTPASDVLASFRPLEEEPSFHHSLRVLCLLLVPRLHGQCVYNRNPSWSRVFPILRQNVIQRAMFDVVGVEGQSICRILSRFRLYISIFERLESAVAKPCKSPPPSPQAP